MARTEAQKRATKKWNDAHMKERYDRVQLVLPAGRKATLEAHAQSKGESVNGYVNTLIRTDMGLSEAEWKNPHPPDAETDA